MNQRKLYITLDTEADADIHWKKEYPHQFTSVCIGIPKFLRPLWDKYNINPIYFVSPEVVKDKNSCEVLKREIKKGAIIGAHLHSEYIEPYVNKEYMNIVSLDFPCSDYETEIETEKIKNLTEGIERNLGVKPKWYRAARFGADIDTIKILADLGYQYDSSVTPCIDWSKKKGPNHKAGIVKPYIISPNNLYAKTNKGRIKEYPVTILGKRFGILGKLLPDSWLFYDWLRPTHMFLWEQKHLIRKAQKLGLYDLIMMFHSMEIMINKTPYVRTRMMQKYFLWKLDKTIKYAIKNGYQSI